MRQSAARVALATLVAVGVIVGVLALWKLKVLIALLFLAFIVAAAMQPSVEWLRRRRVPRGIGIGLHYLAVAGLVSLLPRDKRRVVRDTWDLIDLKLGAYVRGQLILICAVATVLSAAFFAIGLPYWLLVGIFAGVVEIVPVIGPLTAGALAVGVGLTESWHLGLAAGLVVLAVRLLEDYLVIPNVLGDAVGLSPLVVLVSVTATAILFGGWAILLAIPLTAVLVTLISVVVLEKDPAEEDVPAVLFPAKDAEG
jgi:predicted PurR-regulated permease PerM